MSQPRKKKILEEVKRGRRRRALTTTAIVALLMVVIVVAIVLSLPHPQQSGIVGTPISTALYNQLSGVSYSTLASVGAGQGVKPLTPVSGTPLTSDGKPEVLYIGAEYCPFCAAERWSIVVALSKFGSFNGLTYMLSGSAPESYSDTSTLSFHGSSYASQYISFVSVEEQDRSHSPLETPTSQQQSILNQYGSGGIPFIDIGNQYVYSGSQYSPGTLSGLNWTQIGAQLDSPNSVLAKSVDGAANTLITAICKVDGGIPSSVCGQSFASVFMAPVALDYLPISSNLSPVTSTEVRPKGAEFGKAV